ncbi:aldehyde dehydrogenase family protein, partial [Pseudomonas syringae group genomosp. 7]|uniref:aldehyde dehydrogenase family protein n=1 Tax=Pseudomonas syringae group genomosp. 7 TaxID=251699 RepID=UPI00376F960A
IPALILERKEQLGQAISLEMGAGISCARAMQVPLAAEHLRVARDLLATYRFHNVEGGTAIEREPIGECGQITPWNTPM